MKFFSLVLAIVLVLAIPIVAMNPIVIAPAQYGPRSDYTLFFYADENILYTALKAGAIDSMMWELSSAQYQDAIWDPNIILMPVPRYDMVAWSLCCNYTISDYPGVRNVMHDINFRTAIHHCTDRDYYAEVVCGGFARPLYVPVTESSQSWWNLTTVQWVKDNLGYDPGEATAALTAGGFIDTDMDGVRNYPVGWPGRETGPNLDPLIVVRRVDDTKRRDAMDHLTTRLALCNIPLNVIDAYSEADAQARVKISKNYHIYSSRWSVGRYPTHLYDWFHSSRWVTGASSSNYHTGYDQAGASNFPDLDIELESLNYAPSISAAQTACRDAQDLIMRKYAMFIPLWCSYAFYAYRNLLATVNEQGYGPEHTNTYLPLKAYRADNPTMPIRVGIKNPPVSLNPITASSPYEASVFSRYMDNFLDMTPYDVLADVPWAVQDWEVGQWVDPDTGTAKTKVTYWLRPGQEWIAPITGNVLAPRNATDHPFSCWYHDACGPADYLYTGYRDIKYIVKQNDYALSVYFDVNSFWAYLWPWGRDLYPPAWKQSPLAILTTKTFVEGVNLTTPGFLGSPSRSIGAPVEIVSMTEDSIPMTLDTTPYLATHTGDYAMAGDTTSGPRMRIFTDLADGTVVQVQYWARGDYPGNTPGGLPWEQMLVGSGPHYLTDVNHVMGGWATFKANHNHWIETPPLPELDFYYYYEAGPKPRNGYYLADIMDYTRAVQAYESTGNGAPGGRPPSANWDPSADVVNPPGYVDLQDLITIVQGIELPDIAVTDLKPLKNFVGQTYRCKINVTVANLGDASGTFDLTLYAESTPPPTPLGTITVSDLEPGESRNITFAWNTSLPSLWAKANYTMSAHASSPWPGELNTANNNLMRGWIFVSIPGDTASAYRLVDIFDVVRITGIYEYHPSDPGYDPNSDIDDNDFIDIYDVVACTGHYEESW